MHNKYSQILFLSLAATLSLPASANSQISHQPATITPHKSANQFDRSGNLFVLTANTSIPFSWTAQGVHIDLPAAAEKNYEKSTGFNWVIKDAAAKKPSDALADAIWLAGVVTINNKEGAFQGITFAEALKYEYNDNLKAQRQGKFTEVRWLTIDGVKGYLSVDAATASPYEHRKIVWKCYRVYQGLHQLLEFSVYTSNRAFAKNQDEMQKLLLSLKLAPPQ